MQCSYGLLPFLITSRVGNWHEEHSFFVGFIKANFGRLNVVLQSGYLLQAINLDLVFLE